MDIAYRRRLKIALVVTRDISESNGRTPMLSHIVRALSARHDTDVLQLRTILEQRDGREIVGAFARWIASGLKGRPLPLQCVLYSSPRQCLDLARHIAQSRCDAVYLDTVRALPLLRQLRRTLPSLHVVTDFDDLMSRRARYLFEKRLPFVVGHTGRHFPRWLRTLTEVSLARTITAYEALTLPRAEDDAIRFSDMTVLLSSADRDILQNRKPKGAVCSIPPAVTPIRAPQEGWVPQRFIFIGSDSFIQNRTAIDFLLKTWQLHEPPLALHIYGRQSRPPAAVRGVFWHGFVEDLAKVYQFGSIALVPALDRGGIKTKVLEAWAWGCPVLGNPPAFEGLPLTGYPLVLAEDEWSAILTAPRDYEAAWLRAARMGYELVRNHFSAELFARSWERVMDPHAAAMATPVDTQANLPAQKIRKDRKSMIARPHKVPRTL